MSAWRVYHGDVRALVPRLPPGAFDAVLCDPPYGLEFMGHGWDRGVPPAPIWREVRRVLRPGAMLLAAGGTRTYHRLACAIEDGGFEIRDCVAYAWVYGSGFPKSLDVSKAIDKAAGAQLDSVDVRVYGDGHVQRSTESIGYKGCDPASDERAITTPEAAAWSGYGTALAPAWEPYVLAMRPTDGTFAQNARRHGVAGLNVDGARIGTSKDVPTSPPRAPNKIFGQRPDDLGSSSGYDPNVGRWPKNLILDQGAGAMLDASGPVTGHPVDNARSKTGGAAVFGKPGHGAETRHYAGVGGPSRFFYCAKALTKERNAGLPEGVVNDHPTLKPIALCRYLATMILPPPTGRPRRLFVPFAGAGSEMLGALLAGWEEVVGIEQSEAYVATARQRLAEHDTP